MIQRNNADYSMIRVESWHAFHLVKFDIKFYSVEWVNKS